MPHSTNRIRDGARFFAAQMEERDRLLAFLRSLVIASDGEVRGGSPVHVEGLSDGVLSLRDEDGQLYDVTVTLIREVGRG